MKIATLFIFFICFCHFAGAQGTIVIKDKKTLLPGSKHIQFLEDESGKLTLKDILSPVNQQKFKQNNQDIIRYNTSVVWFKVTVQNLSGEDIWFEIGDSFSVWYADFYAPLFNDASLL